MAPPQPHWASMPRCVKAVIVGPAHVGKSSLVKNLLVRGAPWAACYVCHGAASHTKEYQLLDYTPITWDDATPEFWAAESAKHGGRPLAVVTDDYAYADASKKARANLYAFVQFCCSHMNISSFMVAHSWTQLTPRLRRLPRKMAPADEELLSELWSVGMKVPALVRKVAGRVPLRDVQAWAREQRLRDAAEPGARGKCAGAVQRLAAG